MYVLFIRLFVHDALLAWFIYRSIKRPLNDHIISTQHFATLLVAACCTRLASMLRCVATCWVLLAQIWKWSNFKFFFQLLWMLHDIVVVWPRSCNGVAPGYAHLLDFQYPTFSNTSQHGGQKRATCCTQQCCDMSCSNVVIVWPEPANARPTVSGYVVLKCCDIPHKPYCFYWKAN